MPIILLIMHREVIAQGLMGGLQDSPDFHFIYEPDYDHANLAVQRYEANVALIEAAESGLYDIDCCLTLCKGLRKDAPRCKLLMMCSEDNDHNVKLVVEAKGKKIIDDFVFYDVTMDYLVSKLASI